MDKSVNVVPMTFQINSTKMISHAKSLTNRLTATAAPAKPKMCVYRGYTLMRN